MWHANSLDSSFLEDNGSSERHSCGSHCSKVMQNRMPLEKQNRRENIIPQDSISAGVSTLRHNTINAPQFRAYVTLPAKQPYHYNTHFKNASLSQLITPRTQNRGRAHLVPPVLPESPKIGLDDSKLTYNTIINSSSVFDKRENFKEKRLITGCTKGNYNQKKKISEVMVARTPYVNKKLQTHPTMMSHLQGSTMGLLPANNEYCYDFGKDGGRKKFGFNNTSSLSSDLVPIRQELDQFLVGHPSRSLSSISRKARDEATTGLQRGLCRIPSDEHLMDAVYRTGISKSGKRHYQVPWNHYNFCIQDSNIKIGNEN